MRAKCLIVPGVNGSDSNHWQAWLHERREGCEFLPGVDYAEPVLARWAEQIRQFVINSRGPIIIVAHSFGCLATVLALKQNQPNVIGTILVAPASPSFFSHDGLISENNLAGSTRTSKRESVLSCVPREVLGIPGLVIGSSNDPWMKMLEAKFWADCWGLQFLLMHGAGHINAQSGFGKWNGILTMLDRLEEVVSWPLGNILRDQSDETKRSRELIEARRKIRTQLY